MAQSAITGNSAHAVSRQIAAMRAPQRARPPFKVKASQRPHIKQKTAAARRLAQRHAHKGKGR